MIFRVFSFPTGTNVFPYKYELLGGFLPYRYELYFLTSTNYLQEVLPYKYEFIPRIFLWIGDLLRWFTVSMATC